MAKLDHHILRPFVNVLRLGGSLKMADFLFSFFETLSCCHRADLVLTDETGDRMLVFFFNSLGPPFL